MFEVDTFLPLVLAFQEVHDHAPAASFADWMITIPWFAWIAIVAILSGGFSGAVAASCRHRERMAMISQGMHPDNPESAREFKAAHREL